MTSLSLAQGVTLTDSDRSRNVLVTGTPGVGTTNYLVDLIEQDIKSSTPVIVFDPYGDLVDKVLSATGGGIKEKVEYINLGDKEFPVGLNIFDNINEENSAEVSTFLIDILYDLYDPNRTGVIGPRFEHAVRNAVSTIMYDQNPTFLELLRCLTDSEYVKKILPKVKDPVVQNYWNKQVAQTSDFHKSEILDYIISKLGIFVTDKLMRRMLSQSKTSINFSNLLKGDKVVLVNFSELRKYSDANKVITSIFVYKLLEEIAKEKPSSCINLYIDESTIWPSVFITKLLEDGRRYGVNTVLTTNKISESPQSLRRSLMRIGSLVSFRATTADAEILVPEFHNSSITVDKLCLLYRFNAYVKSVENGNVVIHPEPFDFTRDMPQAGMGREEIDELKKSFRTKFGTPAKAVEENISKRMK
jgi:hypothetical protein